MQLSDDVREKLKSCSPPKLFRFEHIDNTIVDIEETDEAKGDVLLFSIDKKDAFDIVASNFDAIGWFVYVDKDLNVYVMGEPEEDTDVTSIFNKLSKFKGFEYRQEQVKMAKIILDAFENSKNAVLEAPTGTGKSLAYLVPAVVFAKRHNKRVVISTNTKNLQQQLLKKDLPVLESILNFKSAIAFGRNNYLCKRKAENILSKGDAFLFESDVYAILKEFLLSTETGLKSEFFSKEKGIDESAWKLIESDSLSCAHRKCPYYKNQCFFYRARKKLDLSHIIIANHHLVLSHSIMENAEILPEFDVLVVDEAHNIERNATNYYTDTLTSFDVLNTLDMLYSSKKGKERGLLSAFDETDLKDKVLNVKEKLKGIFEGLLNRVGSDEVVLDRKNSYEYLDFFKDLVERLDDLQLALKGFISQLDEDDALDIKSVYVKIEGFNKFFKSFIEFDDNGKVYWLKGFKKTVHFNITPINIREALRSYLMENLSSIVFTSATLTVNGDFEFFKRTVGIDDAIEYVAESNFDYKKNSKLFLVYDMLKPDDKDFVVEVSSVLVSIAQALGNTNRGVLVLFTSYKALDFAYDLSRKALEKLGFNVLKQGELDNFELLSRFKKGKGFLFATSSFWEGIDVKGEELSVVVIVKLPFEVPTTAVERVRYDVMKKEGTNPFLEYALPKAVLRLRQGLGRLIRHKTDRGVMVILDSRIVNKSYGKVFLNSLDYMSQERISKDEVKDRISHFFSSISR